MQLNNKAATVIAAATQIISSYSLGGDNVHPKRMHISGVDGEKKSNGNRLIQVHPKNDH